MPDSFLNQRRDEHGRFVKKRFIRDIPSKVPKGAGKRGMGGYVVMSHNFDESRQKVAALKQQVLSTAIGSPEERAARLQQRLQQAALFAYGRSGTGRFARGIRAKAVVRGDPTGTKVESGILITMINYREAKFLTNIGGGGYFKEFPVGPYRIYAKGAEGYGDLSGTNKRQRSREISFAKENVSHRLKVPRATAFFSTVRKSRGPAESRVIGDVLGPADPGDRMGAFFYYPLWVNHPGFPEDIISNIAVEEGARYQEETLQAVTYAHKQVGEFEFEDVPTGTLSSKSLVPSRFIPLPGLSVGETADSRLIGFARGLERKPRYIAGLRTITGEGPRGPSGFLLTK